MRTLKLFGAALILLLAPALRAQSEAIDSTGLPGDNFSLEGAIELFKQSASPEEFEKLLNSENSKINNLDLNEDGEIDYIRVVDNVQGDAHAIVLQVAVSENESQDIAVIEIEKNGDESAILQIIGNEDIYGQETIAEPFEEEKVKGSREKGPAPTIAPIRIIVNVWLWPSVRYIYRPAYVVWVSPWYWRAYPTWWRPWRPQPRYVYHGWVRPYRAHYHVIHTHRVTKAHAVYTPHRRSSTVVRSRTTKVVAARGKNGNVVSKKTTTTTTRGRNAQVKETKTTTRGRNGQMKESTKSTRNQNGQMKERNTRTKVEKQNPRGNGRSGEKSKMQGGSRRGGRG